MTKRVKISPVEIVHEGFEDTAEKKQGSYNMIRIQFSPPPPTTLNTIAKVNTAPRRNVGPTRLVEAR